MNNAILELLSEFVKLSKEEIPGIEDLKKSTNPPRSSNAIWEYVLQKHRALKAGDHSDLRLADKDRAYSWALRKGLPEPGKQHLAVKQPDHTKDYLDFTGEIKSKYGKGTVSKEDRSRFVKILKSRPDLLKFVLMHKAVPKEFSLYKPKGEDWKPKDWLLRNITPLFKKRKLSKTKYKTVSESDIYKKYLSSSYALQPKIDASHAVIDFDKDITRVFSPRESKVTEEALQYTYSLPKDTVMFDNDLKGTRARGEIFFIDEKGKILPMRTIAGILNSTPYNALKKIKEKKLEPRIYLFDVEKFKGKDVANKSYKDKLEMLRKIDKVTPDEYMFPENAVTEDEKVRMLMSIKEGKHPYTKEGVVIRNLETAERPIKFKVRPSYDVFIRKIVEGKIGSSGYLYSFTPRGQIVGKVGTGFSHATRKDMEKNPDKYIGRIAVVDAEERFPSGALRAPSHQHLHSDK